MKIVLIVPDGVAVRNYIYSDFINELKKAGFEIVLYHQIPNAAINEINEVQNAVVSEIIRIPNFKEGFLSRILRESIVYARILHNIKLLNNKTIFSFWNGNASNFKRLVLVRMSEFLGYFISKKYSWIVNLEKTYEKTLFKNKAIQKIEQDIQKINPDYILNLHQRAIISAPIIAVAKKKSIQTGTVIFSWDNIPKARLISKYDSYFVWSELMKKDLNYIYPEINLDPIKVVGSPQFEFYFKEQYKQTKSDFFATFNLDISKKTICFSANDTLSPYDQIYLEDLCEALLKWDEKERPQVLFRKCPVDLTNRFDMALNKYKDLIIPVQPDWRIESEDVASFVSIYPSYNDISLLVNTVLHSDVVVNLGSTMAHDFAVYNKPCLYLNYDPVSNPTLKVKDVFAFQHFKSMNNLEAVGWITTKDDYLPKLKEALLVPENTGKDRLKWLETIVQHPLQDNSKKLVKEILLCTSV
jgi:hypothetical protein